MLPRLRPIPINERISYLFLERGQLDVLDGCFVLVNKEGTRTHIPVGAVTCLFLEPGIRVSHAAVKLAAQAGCLLTWVGEAGVRLYSAGQPGGGRSDRLLFQASLALAPKARLKVVRKMFQLRFGEAPPKLRSVAQLRGIEGTRVQKIYQTLAKKYKLPWKGRQIDPKNKGSRDPLNAALSIANAALYGVTEAAVLAAGYAPSIGFVHWGQPRAFVYDIADLVKFETVVPLAFEIVAQKPAALERAVRGACRDSFRESRLLKRLIPLIEEVCNAGGTPPQDMEMADPNSDHGVGDVSDCG